MAPTVRVGALMTLILHTILTRLLLLCTPVMQLAEYKGFFFLHNLEKNITYSSTKQVGGRTLARPLQMLLPAAAVFLIPALQCCCRRKQHFLISLQIFEYIFRLACGSKSLVCARPPFFLLSMPYQCAPFHPHAHTHASCLILPQPLRCAC